MTRNEILAHNSGVAAVLDLAARSALAMQERLVEKPTRYNFAIEALTAIAEEGANLLLPMPPGAAGTTLVEPSSPPPRPTPLAGLERAAAVEGR